MKFMFSKRYAIAANVVTVTLLASCGGNAVDLGNAGPDVSAETWSNRALASHEVETLYSGSGRVIRMQVDEQRLYALFRAVRGEIDLRTCLLDACASTQQVLFRLSSEQTNATKTQLLLDRDELFFAGATEKDGERLTIWSCPAAHCSEAVRTLATETTISSSLTVSADHLFWLDGGLGPQRVTRISRSASDAPVYLATLERQMPPNHERTRYDQLVLHGQFLYMRSPKGHVIRMPVEGGAEQLVYDDPAGISQIAVTDQGVFIASDRLSGELYQCPLEGCGAMARVLAARQAYPWAVLADGSKTYWMNRGTKGTQGGLGSVLACTTATCEGPQTLANQLTFDIEMTEAASNSTALFWTANQPLVYSNDHLADLMRLAK
jgi:hypothetical protein